MHQECWKVENLQNSLKKKFKLLPQMTHQFMFNDITVNFGLILMVLMDLSFSKSSGNRHITCIYPCVLQTILIPQLQPHLLVIFESACTLLLCFKIKYIKRCQSSIFAIFCNSRGENVPNTLKKGGIQYS